jgi:hypothetical protein
MQALSAASLSSQAQGGGSMEGLRRSARLALIDEQWKIKAASGDRQFAKT